MRHIHLMAISYGIDNNPHIIPILPFSYLYISSFTSQLIILDIISGPYNHTATPPPYTPISVLYTTPLRTPHICSLYWDDPIGSASPSRFSQQENQPRKAWQRKLAGYLYELPASPYRSRRLDR